MVDLPSDDTCALQIQQIFLLEDDVGGGLILTAAHMQRLPPWPDGVGDLLGSVCAVLHALPTLQAAGLDIQAEQFLEAVLAEAGRQLHNCTGRLDAGNQVIYLGRLGGFVCGPVPWTQPKPLSASRLAPATFPASRCAPECPDDDPWEQAWGWERAR